jgi:hypothetical protein
MIDHRVGHQGIPDSNKGHEETPGPSGARKSPRATADGEGAPSRGEGCHWSLDILLLLKIGPIF